MNAAKWALLRLSPAQVRAVAELDRFEAGHPGVRILRPHYHDEPWRADIRKDTAPGDDRAMILTGHQPADLLAKLNVIFPPGSEKMPGGG